MRSFRRGRMGLLCLDEAEGRGGEKEREQESEGEGDHVKGGKQRSYQVALAET